MEEKKFYESEKLHGVYRCQKREDFMKKIPSIDKKELPDITGIVISGILNFGNDPKTIKMMVKNVLNCEEDAIKIPYTETSFARRKFICDVVIFKLIGSMRHSVDSLIKTFYEFLEMPTDATKELQAEEDIRNINRYLNCEMRKPIVIGNQFVNVCDTSFLCQNDFVFKTRQTIKKNKRKEGRRYVYDEEEILVVEMVKLFPGKPQVKESSNVVDVGADKRIELYIMLKAIEKWAEKQNINEPYVLRSSYYYLTKDRENPNRFNENFWEKGGNVVSLYSTPQQMKQWDKYFEPQILEFLEGSSVSAEKCQNCSMKSVCEYREAATPLSEEERPLPTSLPILSEPQSKAANALEGNVRVIATAGSGKTTAMAYRIMNLLKSGVAPEKIGCFTFTNAGAGEMKDRISGFCKIAGVNADIDKMTISTIHSFGDALIKKYYELLNYKKPPVLINEIQKTKIIEEILSTNMPIDELIDKYKNFYLDMFRAKGILELMKEYFNVLLEGTSAEDFQNRYGLNDKTVDMIMDMYMKYLKIKKERCLLEHSDQELGVLKLLKIKPDIFEEVGIEHISVDEYQDTSNIQFKIINAMRQASCTKSLFIVGDDDQSIYGFRDANVELIKDFFDMINETGTDVQLMENRRSTGNIVDFASNLICNNEDRIVKSPVSTNERGDIVSVSCFEDKNKELDYIIDSVDNLINKEHKNENDIAILTPTNSELLVIAEKLAERGINTISINPEPILDNTNVRAVVSLVKFIISTSEFNGLTYLNVRTKGTFVSKNNDEIKNDIIKLKEEMSDVTTVDKFFEKVHILDEEESDEIFQSFIEDIKTAQDEAINNNNLSSVLEYILDFERFGQKQTARKEKPYNGVVLSTMHSSKGKEWPIVFCSVSKLHQKDMSLDAIPEKNRLLFVACTRAKKKLYISGAETIGSSGEENLFLSECIDVYKDMYMA